jgi:hypothetical protein
MQVVASSARSLLGTSKDIDIVVGVGEIFQ